MVCFRRFLRIHCGHNVAPWMSILWYDKKCPFPILLDRWTAFILQCSSSIAYFVVQPEFFILFTLEMSAIIFCENECWTKCSVNLKVSYFSWGLAKQSSTPSQKVNEEETMPRPHTFQGKWFRNEHEECEDNSMSGKPMMTSRFIVFR